MSPLPTRRILIQKGPNGLGFSVKGGGDVGLPLVVSRVESGGGAVGLLKIGMEISAVNGISLEGLPHYAAVEVLRRTRSPVILFVRNSTEETVAVVDNVLLNRQSRQHTLQKVASSSGTLQSSHSKSEYETEYQLYQGTGSEEHDPALSQLQTALDPSHVDDLYDLRTVKRFVKEILHLPKEVFSRKLAWKFPPVALGKFHKWLLSKLQRFDCEAPQNTASYIFDAFSQSLYLARAIYDLVHLIRTLIAMERTSATRELVLQTAPGMGHPAVQAPTSMELHNPQTMACFVAELSEIKAQLARAKEQGNSVFDTQAHISQQNAEIKALREQLMSYEAKIATLSHSAPRNKDNDLGTFFKENFKRIKKKTLKRRQSLTGGSQGIKCEQKVCIRGRQSGDDQSKENYPNNDAMMRSPALSNKFRDSEMMMRSPALSIRSRDCEMNVRSPALSIRSRANDAVCVDIVSSSPNMRLKSEQSGKGENNKLHNEIFVQMGDHIQAHTLQVCSDDSFVPRERLYSSDDDYVQMTGLPSPAATLPRTFDPLKEESPSVVRRISRDYKRSSVSSSQSKASIESIKLKHKQTVMIDSDECDMRNETSDYIQMNGGGENDRFRVGPHSSLDDETEDYVEADALPIRPLPVRLSEPTTSHKGEVSKVEELKKCDKKEKDDRGSDTISTGTLQADVNVTEERQINATQVQEIGNDVDSIMVDVETLHQMEQALRKPTPPTVYPKPSGLRHGSCPATSAVNNGVTSPVPLLRGADHDGPAGMVKAHEVPIYAKVERVTSPPPHRIRPFSFGEASNSSSTSQNELSRHEVCPKTNPRKTSLTSNGSSVELKSDYSSDRPSSYNTSHTASTEHGDRFSRISSDVTPDEDHRLSVISDNKSDAVFSSPAKPSCQDPLSRNKFVPDKPPRGCVAEKTLEQSTPDLPYRDRSLSERRLRGSSSGGLNVSFEVEDLEDCLNKEVGEEFFLKGKKEKKPTPFKKIITFGKGKKKRSSSSGEGDAPAITRARQPDIINTEGFRVSGEDFRHSSHSRHSSISSPQPYQRSRGNSGASLSSSSGHSSRHSTSRQSRHSSNHSTDGHLADYSRNSVTASVYSGDYSSPVNVSPIGEHEPAIEGHAELKSNNSSSSIIYPGCNNIPNNDSYQDDPVTNDLERKSSKGFYDELGIKINFDEIPVKNEQVLDLTNETIIDLDGDIIKDPEELRILRGENGKVERFMDSNLSAKVDTELRIHNECTKMVQEIELITTPPPLVIDTDSIKNRDQSTPSPSFSEIDMLLGNITADLDNLSF